MIKLPTLTVCTGTMGSGKSYCRVRFAWDWIKARKTSRVITNLPLNLEHWPKGRVLLFPQKEVDAWRRDTKDNPPGPWTFTEEHARPGDLIIVDEVQYFIPNRGKVEARYAWLEWISMLRHEGCYLMIATQNPALCDDKILKLADEEHVSIDVDKKLDPVFHVALGDWKTLLRLYTGIRSPQTFGVEIRRRKGRETEIAGTYKYSLDPRYFKLYNSYSASEKTGKAGQDEVTREEFLKLFWRSNGGSFAMRAAQAATVAAVAYWAVFYAWPDFIAGPGKRAADGITRTLEPITGSAPGSASSPDGTTAAPAIPPGTCQL